MSDPDVSTTGPQSIVGGDADLSSSEEVMRNVALFFLLLSTLCRAQLSTGEYSINVHVSSSEWVVIPSGIGPVGAQKLNVVIGGKKYELEADVKGRTALLTLGDYRARLLEDVHKNSYESSQTYEFQFSDGKTRKFVVVGQTE